MATLIQSKQIQGVVTASVIEGDFLVSGSLLTSGSMFVDGDITASGVIKGTYFEGDGSRLRGIVAESVGINLVSGAIDEVASQLDFSGSGLTLSVNNNTASISIKSGYEEGGLFRTYSTYNTLLSSSVSNFSDGQIVYVVSNNTLYQADITYADMITTFTDTIVWNSYTFEIGDSSVDGGNGLSKSVLSGVTTLTLDTGSNHFQRGVEFVISSGSYIIDSGLI
jgi:hypothetical protein